MKMQRPDLGQPFAKMRPKAEAQKQGKKDLGTTETWEPTSEQPGFGVFCSDKPTIN